MPTPRGRNRKARRAAAASAPESPAAAVGETNSDSKMDSTASSPGHEKRRRLRKGQEHLKQKGEAKDVAVTAAASQDEKGLASKGKGMRKGKKEEKEKEQEQNINSGGKGIADLDADDFLSGGFMSMTGVSDDEDDDGGREDVEDGDGGETESDDGTGGAGSGGDLEEAGSSSDEDDEANEMDLKALEKTDPEFYKFLEKEEPTLLEFNPMESEGSEDDEGADGAVPSDTGVGEGAGAAKSAAEVERGVSKGSGVLLTMALLEAMQQQAFGEEGTIQGVKRMIKAFRCGCHLGDESAEGKDGGGGTIEQKFRIPSSEVYNELMVRSLEGLHVTFMLHLFPDKRSTSALAAMSAPSAKVSSTGKDGVGRKRSRREGSEGEELEKKSPGREESGTGPGKKRKHSGNTVGDGTAAAVAARAVSEKAGQVIAGAATAAAPFAEKASSRKGVTGGGLARVTPRAAVVLTKGDFRAAALRPEWKTLQPALYSFFKSLLHVLEELHDRALLGFLLSRLEHYVPLLVPFPGLARGFLKALIGLWGGAGAEAKSSGGGTEEETKDAERVRLLAYLRVRQMAAALPFPFVEGCMKRLYLAFAKKARAPPASQEGKVSMRVMEGCVVELYGMDVGSAYQNAFLYIRQLSLLLRRAMQHKTKDSIQSVRRWQVVTCLRVWTGVLAAAPDEDGLKTLIFPLAQVIGGIVRLSGTLRHSPLVFQLVRMRQRLAAAAGLYVPCSTPLLEVIRSPALFKKATASTEAPPNIPGILRLGKAQVDEGRAQGAVVEEALRLLGQEMDLYRYSAAFPELVVPVIGRLKKFAKMTKVSKWRMMARGLVEVLEARGMWAAKKRVELRICPSEVEGLEVLRPKGAPTMRERLGASEAAVERVVDDESPAAPAAVTKGRQKKVPTKKRPEQDDSEDEDYDSGSEDEREDEDGDDDDDAGTAPKRKRSSLSSTTSRGSGTVGTVSAGAGADGDVSAPDVVEDLSAWDDDEWD